MSFEGRREDGRRARTSPSSCASTATTRADFTIVERARTAPRRIIEPGERTIARGDAVVMDFGGVANGYCSRHRRGRCSSAEPTRRSSAASYDTVQAAQRRRSTRFEPGVAAQQIDRAARAVIDDAGIRGACFVHRTGHGIGLEVHEPPYMVEGDTTILCSPG